MASAPAPTSAAASASTSSGDDEPGTRSAPETRTITGASPAASRTARVTASGNARRRAASPPQASSRRFVTGEANWLSRYPSDAITSTPSNPRSIATAAADAKSAMVAAMPSSSSATGSAWENRLNTADGATGVSPKAEGNAYRPAWNSSSAMRPPAACTASTTPRQGAACAGSLISV
ncbi:hypothetical protein L2X98_32380 [Microbacterium elymi]|uniref:Uncharacterized protein n=1 Tax=Microbacterium elymi TaxID=2909587 RepID=A0ABY5NIM5_9MICO|nr:hypothetical protein [Microbacterium elymi]UUT35020.1 hypothetical protein L2X98_32380 [Microbacterium elymi]